MLNKKLDALQIFWGATGKPNLKDARYFGLKFPNMETYLNELKKFLRVDDINQHILDEINAIIVEHGTCGQYVKVVGYNVEDYPLRSLEDYGYGGKPTIEVRYVEDPDFDCPYEDEYGDCFFYECVSPALDEVRRFLKSKYGFIGFNVSGGSIDLTS